MDMFLTVLLFLAMIVMGFVSFVGVFLMPKSTKGEKLLGYGMGLSFLVILGHLIYGC